MVLGDEEVLDGVLFFSAHAGLTTTSSALRSVGVEGGSFDVTSA